MSGFRVFAPTNGYQVTDTDPHYPSVLTTFHREELRLDLPGTHYGYIHSGTAMLESEAGRMELGGGMFFCQYGDIRVTGSGVGFVATRLGYRGMRLFGGPLEAEGRLRYIDGCTDSLLLAPPLMGDPCLNLLHFPQGIEQTAHTHPSVRMGMVTSGSGVCRLQDASVPLKAGCVFMIPPETVHHFATEERHMSVVAYHPDSDFGPQHDNHPMINRTHVDGVSARYLNEIRTEEIATR